MTNTIRRRSNLTLILGAMPQEALAIRRNLTRAREDRLSVFPYDSGFLGDRRVILGITGVGKTNASMVSSIFAYHFEPSEVIFTGTASRINTTLRTGDIILGATTVHHDMGTLNSEGMCYHTFRGPLRGSRTPFRYSADRRLLKLALAAAESYRPRAITVDGATYLPSVRPGIICAGDVFGQSQERIEGIRRELKADLMEMEGSSISQVCRQLKVPHLVIRAGSNLTQESPSDDYRRLGPIAAHSAARFTMHLVSALEFDRRNSAAS